MSHCSAATMTAVVPECSVTTRVFPPSSSRYFRLLLLWRSLSHRQRRCSVSCASLAIVWRWTVLLTSPTTSALTVRRRRLYVCAPLAAVELRNKPTASESLYRLNALMLWSLWQVNTVTKSAAASRYIIIIFKTSCLVYMIVHVKIFQTLQSCSTKHIHVEKIRVCTLVILHAQLNN